MGGIRMTHVSFYMILIPTIREMKMIAINFS